LGSDLLTITLPSRALFHSFIKTVDLNRTATMIAGMQPDGI